MKRTKHDELVEWVKERGIVSAVDVRNWGLENFYLRADRTMRQLAEIGQIIRRLADDEIDQMGLRKPGSTRIAYWSVV